MSGEFNHSFDILRTFKEAIREYVEVRVESAKKHEESTLVIRISDNIKNLFQFLKKENDTDKTLAGRIVDLNHNADRALEYLKKVKEELKNEVDDDLHPFIDGMMAPMIRDVMRIQKSVVEDGPLQQQADAFENYNRWMDDAILLVELCTKTKDKESISRMFIKHTFDEVSVCVDRDLQFIDDYLTHEIDKLGINEAERYLLAETLQNKLKRYIHSLLGLKKHPKNLSIENLSNWKEMADRRRNRYLDTILEVIDDVIYSGQVVDRGEHGLLKKVVYLEIEVPMLCDKIFFEKELMGLEEELIYPQLVSLEQELHELYRENGSSHPQDIQDRLDVLKEMLVHAFKKIDHG